MIGISVLLLIRKIKPEYYTTDAGCCQSSGKKSYNFVGDMHGYELYSDSIIHFCGNTTHACIDGIDLRHSGAR